MSMMNHRGKPNLPPEAELEVLAYLSHHRSIDSEKLASILKKHQVCGDPEALQDSYRKRLGQRLIASIRDDSGKRELLSTGHTYVILECCNDSQTLQKISKNLDKDMAGFNCSKAKVKQRIAVLNRFSFGTTNATKEETT